MTSTIERVNQHRGAITKRYTIASTIALLHTISTGAADPFWPAFSPTLFLNLTLIYATPIFYFSHVWNETTTPPPYLTLTKITALTAILTGTITILHLTH